MTTFSVYSDGSLRRAERQMDDDLPVHVDDTTTVRLSNDNEIVISQGVRPGYSTHHIIVRDVFALTKALTQAQLVTGRARRNARRKRADRRHHPQRLFAALSEVYPGINKDRTRRLAKLNLFAGRPKDDPITSLSDRYCDMTNGDARRVFDMLNEIRDDVMSPSWTSVRLTACLSLRVSS